jgi:hypothetical protein
MSPTIFLLSAAFGTAHACPTVATGTNQELTYDVARTAIVRQNGRITFTVSINPEGAAQDFALVLPVPALLQEDDIAVLDGEVFARLEGYTSLLTMSDAGCVPSDSATGGAGGGLESGEGDGVVVEAEYLVGDYQIAILSATESAGLFNWLDDNGYQLAEATLPVLEDYIDQGMFFMTAKVAPEAAVADGTPLPPLQVAYDAEVFSIPIRLAARNSPGQQDMLIYAITDKSDLGGRVAVSNYSEFSIPDKCIWGNPATDDFNEFYENEFRPLWADAGYAGWTTEWAGEWGSCSPCSGVQITDEDLDALGFDGGLDSHFLTRLHVRYTPDTATQDLMLYASGLTDAKVTSFADDNALNRECIDVCGEASTDGGSGDSTDDPIEYEGDDTPDLTEPASESKSSGCAVVSGGGALVAVLAGVLVGVRRREDEA